MMPGHWLGNQVYYMGLELLDYHNQMNFQEWLDLQMAGNAEKYKRAAKSYT